MLITSVNLFTDQEVKMVDQLNLFTEEVKMVDQLKQDCCIAHAVRGDPSSQSSPKWKMMESTQSEEVLVEDTKIRNIS